MPGLSTPPDATLERHSFPGGNSGYARYFLKSLIPESIAGGREFADIITGRINFSALDRHGQPLRMRLDATAVSVQHEGPADASERVRVVYAHAGRLRLARAKSVIMATGGWINRHVVRDLPEGHRNAYRQFHHAPFLVANVAVNNWRFMHRLGITAAIWEKTDGGFGRTCNIRRPMVVGCHQPPLDPSQPAVLSFYTPFYYPGSPIDSQVQRGRIELLMTSYPEFERKIVNQMLELFGSAGFRRDAGHRRHHSKSVGARLLGAVPGILWWCGGRAGAAGNHPTELRPGGIRAFGAWRPAALGSGGR